MVSTAIEGIEYKFKFLTFQQESPGTFITHKIEVQM